MKHFWHKVLIGAAVGIGIYTLAQSAPIITRYSLCHYKDGEIEEFVEQNLEDIIAAEEKAVGIHFKDRPTIKYLLPPKARLEISAINTSGLYLSTTDTIYLNSGLLVHPVPDTGDILASLFTDRNVSDVVGTLYHELGHFYCDSLAEDFGLGDWPMITPDMGKNTQIGIRLVAEGIAEYMERKTLGDLEDSFTDEEWPKDLNGFLSDDNYFRMIYHGGYHLVRPIIDESGPKGILYLMLFPPTGEDIFRLPEYQQRLLDLISGPQN